MAVQYSIQKMVSDGTLSTIALGIQYLQRNDIYIRIAGEETPQSGAESGYTWGFIDNTTIKILPVVPNGVEVVVYRRTDADSMYNIYSQNAQFDEATIDENNQQLLYIAQEYLEQGIPGVGVESVEFIRQVSNVTYYRMKLTDGSYTNEFYIVAPLPSEGAYVDTIAELRSTVPLVAGELVDVISYYGGWAVINGGEPKFGGRFWYDPNDSVTPDDGFKTIVTTGGKRWKRTKGQYGVGHAGAVEDDSIDSTAQVQAAVNGTKSGEELGFYGGPFNFDKVELTKPIILVGDADIKHNGFRIKSSRITSQLSGRQICRNYQSSSRAFECKANEDAADYEDFKILFNRFEGFFYTTAFLARDYSLVIDPNARVVKDTKIIGCTSVAPTALSAGHFQHIGVTNSETSHCSTYGGQGATSYNFINQNGYVRIIGNYDENNLYGSCELENSKVSNSVISGNTFGNDLWVDDTSNVTISGNTTAGVLRVTAETVDVYNLTISANTAKQIRVEQFGGAPVGFVYDSILTGNTATGADVGGTDIFLGALVTGEASSNRCNGPTTHIGAVRYSGSNLLLRNNSGKGGVLLISGSGGTLVEYGNIGMVISGASDSKHLSNMMKPSKDYLDLPGKYLHGTKFSGSMSPGATAAIALPIPVSQDPSFRGVALWVLIRDRASNNISSFRIDGRYVYVGTAALVFGTSYSAQGADAAVVTVANNASTSSSINILLTNTSGTKTLQVTVMPEVSSRLGTEE